MVGLFRPKKLTSEEAEEVVRQFYKRRAFDVKPMVLYYWNRMRDYVANGTQEEHDFLVYRLGGEFDTNDESAVNWVTSRLASADMMDLVLEYGILRSEATSSDSVSKACLVQTTTYEGYQKCLEEAGLQPSQTMLNSIARREAREDDVRSKKGITYVPSPGRLVGLVEDGRRTFSKIGDKLDRWHKFRMLRWVFPVLCAAIIVVMVAGAVMSLYDLVKSFVILSKG